MRGALGDVRRRAEITMDNKRRVDACPTYAQVSNGMRAGLLK